jgi:hypothetical protein
MKLIRLVTAAAVCAPFGLSVAAHSTADRPPAAVVSERPALAFREYLLNLGRMTEGRPVPGRFWFVNNGATPLKILGFEPSCGCLMPQLDKEIYAPGEQGTFVVVADTAGQSLYDAANGADASDQVKQHHIRVRYDAGNGPQSETIHLKFVLPARRVVVEPRSLIVYQFSDQPTTREITVTDRRTPPVNVVGAESASPRLLVASTIADSMDEPTRATVSVTVPGSLDRNVRTLLTIHTDDPHQPEIHVPIIVQVRETAEGAPQ